MVWNTIAHPRMMEESQPSGGEVDMTQMPLQYVSTGKQNVYDLILSIDHEVIIVYGDYDDLCAKLVRGELVLCTSVVLSKSDNMSVVHQSYSALSAYKSIAMTTEKTIHGKPVILVEFDEGSKYIIDCNNAIYVLAKAPFDDLA